MAIEPSINVELSMQGTDSSEKGNAPTPKPTKYRLACDTCQHSKIRCDQERPKCRRCAKKGIECVYSPARRAGRPRTRNNGKSSSSVEKNTSASLKGYLKPIAEHDINIAASGWTMPFAPPSMLSVSENCPSSSSSSNTSTTPGMVQTIQMPSPDDTEFSPYQQSDDDFLQGLLDLTGSQCGTPNQTTNCYHPIGSDFHVTPELLNIGFCRTPREREQEQEQQQQQQQQEQEQHQPTSGTMLLNEGLPYFGLLTPEDHQSRRHPDQHQEDTPIPTTSSTNVDGCSYTLFLQQQVQSKFPRTLNRASPSTESCNCMSTLFDHLCTPSHAPSSSSLASTSAALSSSRMLITCCRTMVVCPNACSTRPSTALVICEAIDRALVSLKLGLWTPTLASISSYKNGTSSSPSSSSSPSASGGDSNENMLSLSAADEEHEPLRCGTMPIRGADRRAVMRVLLVKRVLEVQRVLERLRDTLLSELLVGGDKTAKKPLLALCADVVGEFARKVAERVETVKLHM